MKVLKSFTYFIIWSVIATAILLLWQNYIANCCNVGFVQTLQDNHSILVFAFLNLFLIPSIFLNIPFSLKEAFKVHKFRKRPSWLRYMFVLLFLNPGIIFLINTTPPYFRSEPIYLLFWLFSPFFIVIIAYALIPKLKKRDLEKQQRFAPDAVGGNDDGLEIKPAAENIAYSIEQMNEYVSVISLVGNMGWGKSSFARMVIEALGPEETLYAYLSLTETNEAQDLGKLFAERWSEALNARYPKLDILPYVPFMETVLRDTNFVWLSFFLKCDKGLLPTRTRCNDKHLKYPEDTVSPKVAKMFGNIDLIKEKRWVFVFDEIERAEFDEIFRMIEIMERFKNAGRTGLPLPLVFMLCYDENKLKERLVQYRKSDVKAGLIKDFLINDPKNITKIYPLPLPRLGAREIFVKRKIEETAKELKREVTIDLDSLGKVASTDTYNSWFDDEKDAILHAVDIFISESPRVINRTLDNLKYTLNSLERTAKTQFNVRLSDLIVMEYIKIKYPLLIEFFVRVLDTSDNLINFDIETHKLDKLSKKVDETALQGKNSSENILYEWIQLKTGRAVQGEDKPLVSKLVGLVARFCIDIVEGRNWYEGSGALSYSKMLSSPGAMHRYLSFRLDLPMSEIEQSVKIFEQHSKSEYDLKSLSDEALTNYSGHLRDFKTDSMAVFKDVLMELKNRIIARSFPKRTYRKGHIMSFQDEAIYDFQAMIVRLVMHGGRTEEDIDSAWHALQSLLVHPKVSTDEKYMLLGLFIKDKGVHESREFEMTATQLMRKHRDEVNKVIQQVFIEADMRYFNKDASGDVYASEENYQFVLYQSWSGNAADQNEINMIRDAALRYIDKHPDVIRDFWKPYEANSEGPGRSSLYMPFDKLLEVTKRNSLAEEPTIKASLKRWEAKKMNEESQSLFALRSQSNTLKAIFNASQNKPNQE